MAATPPYTVRGTCDADDRLTRADDSLSDLQRACGGDVPGLLAVPALLALVRSARLLGQPVARTIVCQDEQHVISAWAEAVPSDGGCDVALSGWARRALTHDADGPILAQAATRAVLAGGYLRLDAEQRVLAIIIHDPALHPLSRAIDPAAAPVWSQFFAVDGYDQPGTVHWRLLDGAVVHPAGCDGPWRALLEPQFGAGRSLIGFDLHLVALTHDAGDGQSGEAMAGAVGADLAAALGERVERVVGHAEAIAGQHAGPIDERYATYGADIAAAGRHLRGLLADVAMLAEIGRGAGASAREAIDLFDVARDAAAMLRRQGEAREMTFQLPDPENRLPATADARKVRQILLNLLSNAVTYAPQGSAVVVQGGTDAERAWLTVANDGPGIDPADVERMFEPFERLSSGGHGDNGGGSGGGSGLGLHIARLLAQSMDGELTAASASGEGVRLRLALPAAG